MRHRPCKNNFKQEQQQEEEQQDKEQERIEQGEQWGQGEQDEEQKQELQQEQEQDQEQEEEDNHKNKTKNKNHDTNSKKSLTFDHPWCYAVRSCPWFSNNSDATLSDYSLILQSSGMLPCKILSLTCKSLLLQSKILSVTFKHVGCYALRFCLSCP